MEERSIEQEAVRHNIGYINFLISQENQNCIVIDEIEKVLCVVRSNRSAQIFMLQKINNYILTRANNLIGESIHLRKAERALYLRPEDASNQQLSNQLMQLRQIHEWVVSLYEELNIEEMDTKQENDLKEVFITYSWESEEHNSKVLSFFNHLRKNGYVANIDRKITQENSATDFPKMMHSAITDYQKVIIVLSTGYKEKADKFKGGVGTEYGLIIKDIDDNPKKYILVSFDGISDSIVPLNFKGREVVDLSDLNGTENLFRKLGDQPKYKFDPVAVKKPKLGNEKISEFKIGKLAKGGLEILNLKPHNTQSLASAGHYRWIQFELSVLIKNTLDKTIDGFSIEIKIPQNLAGDNTEGRTDSSYKILHSQSKARLFPEQEFEIEIGCIKVISKFAEEAFEETVTVTVFSEYGKTEKQYPISEILKASKDQSMGVEDLHTDW